MSEPTFSIVHVALMLTVRDLGRSVAFYRDKLGFQVREHEPHIALLAQQAMQLYLITESPPTPDKPGVTLLPPDTPDKVNINIVFRVQDCHAAYDALAKRGVDFLTPPHSPAWGGWRCFTRDPDGYLIEIEQP
jgi:catechol 2,3-dioxygenase-like lactoylglutathione lyase family enzyme